MERNVDVFITHSVVFRDISILEGGKREVKDIIDALDQETLKLKKERILKATSFSLQGVLCSLLSVRILPAT